jgi:hypothetical protein
MAMLECRALAGPPWSFDDIPTLPSTAAHNERALLHYLREEREQGDALLRERHADRVRDVGHAFQRFTPVFPGALVAALGPLDTAPNAEWLIQWIIDPPLSGMWVVHRAIAAMLLAERGGDRALVTAAHRLLEQANPDAIVASWIRRRLEQVRSI